MLQRRGGGLRGRSCSLRTRDGFLCRTTVADPLLLSRLSDLSRAVGQCGAQLGQRGAEPPGRLSAFARQADHRERATTRCRVSVGGSSVPIGLDPWAGSAFGVAGPRVRGGSKRCWSLPTMMGGQWPRALERIPASWVTFLRVAIRAREPGKEHYLVCRVVVDEGGGVAPQHFGAVVGKRVAAPCVRVRHRLTRRTT